MPSCRQFVVSAIAIVMHTKTAYPLIIHAHSYAVYHCISFTLVYLYAKVMSSHVSLIILNFFDKKAASLRNGLKIMFLTAILMTTADLVYHCVTKMSTSFC